MKRFFSLFLTLILLSALCIGCTTRPDTASDAAIPATPESTEPTAQESADTPPVDTVEDTDLSVKYPYLATSMPEGIAESISLPVTEDELTLSLWYTVNNDVPTLPEFNNGQNTFFTEWQNRTGVNLEMMVYSWSQTEAFSLMLVSEEYPDMAQGVPSVIPGGIDKAVEDGVLLSLNDLIDNYAPNYKIWMNYDESCRKNNRTDNGIISVFSQGTDAVDGQGCTVGYSVRQDWLDELGLDTPTTYRDWHDVLSAFKTNKEGCIPLAIVNNGIVEELLSGYGVAPDTSYYMLQKNGTVSCSALDDGFRSYLEMMNQWYSEGLIDPDFTSDGTFVILSRADEIGIGWILNNWAGSYFANAGMASEGTYFSYVSRPVQNEGDILMVDRTKPSRVAGGQGIFLFGSCADPIAAAKMIDYLYTYEGITLMNYGIENETFYYDENGHPYYTEEILATNSNIQNIQMTHLMFSSAGIMLVDRELDYMDNYTRSYAEIWTQGGQWTLPGALTYSSEEGAELASVMSDCSTYISEFAGKVILGLQKLTDESWDQYLNDLDQMNISRAVEITQAAYDRYISR